MVTLSSVISVVLLPVPTFSTEVGLLAVPVITGASLTAVTLMVRVTATLVAAPAASELASITWKFAVRGKGSVALLAFGLSEVLT